MYKHINQIITIFRWEAGVSVCMLEYAEKEEKRRREENTHYGLYSFVYLRRAFFVNLCESIYIYIHCAVALLEMNSIRQTVLSNKRKGNYDVC